MHLLRAQRGEIVDGSEAVDLGQTAADIVILSAADTELALLSACRNTIGDDFPSVRLANWMSLTHNLSVDVYVEDIVANAKLVIVRLLGGRGYWSYGVEQIHATCQAQNIPLALLPGDDQPDEELAALSTLPREVCYRLWQYCVHGGPENAREFYHYCAHILGKDKYSQWKEPKLLLKAGLYWPDQAISDLDELQTHWQTNVPVAAIIFYRALLQAADTAPVDALIKALRKLGINALPVYCASLKDPLCAETISQLLVQADAKIVLNATGFAISTPGETRAATPFDKLNCPILQVIFSGGSEQAWREGSQGLSARNIAMNVALPEVDGRILSRAVAFKGEAEFDQQTQCPIIRYQTVADRVEFVAQLTRNWLRLKNTPAKERHIAIVLANYPNKDGRLGNGVGLDTPASTVSVLRALQNNGYRVDDLPADGNALIQRLAAGPTNALQARNARRIEETLSFADYQIWFSSLTHEVQQQVLNRWGPAEQDPFYQPGELDCGRFVLSAFRLGNIVIGLQPARGYNIDPVASYHDPDLVPPHGYLAFYAWLQTDFRADAVIHMGKHGNLEWLPGKALALSQTCYPEAAFGPLPHIYPFIVNDPGEGTQAKRRAQAVIIDHLTPPLTRAESYGPLAELELLVDEYFEASGVDPRRLKILRDEILQKIQLIGLDQDCGIKRDDDADAALTKLDAYLCELKELQIRDGLHIFGESPQDDLLTDLLVALIRIPRYEGKQGDASLLRALAADLQLDDGFDFDPLDCDFAQPWNGPKPDVLSNNQPWRHRGDTVERLEELAQALVAKKTTANPDWSATQLVLKNLDENIKPAVTLSGQAEINSLLQALSGCFVEPGPSGAPTRGRPEVLPTGRNFYSVDNRTVPTPAAYNLGWKSASLLLERHRQEHGEWPQRIALSAWGTANMRTGGDDIAQALALLGVKPTWDKNSRRVTGFEVLPLEIFDRPRVDVTLRVSGFFRDAFPAQIDLFDSAVRAVAVLDESDTNNPLAARYRSDKEALINQGMSDEQAQQQAGFRVFGAKPGAYGAGLQALIDERGWETDADFAQAYLAWGGYAYGAGNFGVAAQALFASRLKDVEVVLHNQDNREHDLLDSDDYYQFEGGITATIRHLSGQQPHIYHNDHSRPESPKIRTLQEEIARVVRARVVNPKWLKGAMRHGYKGAFELAATVDYLFAFAATARVVSDHHFDAVYDAYLQDEEVFDFLQENNPAALQEIAERLKEAIDRGLWQARSNSAYAKLSELITT